MTKIEKAVQWAVGIANDNSHGYSQNTRWGTPDYDCSSLVISAYEQAGVPVRSNGATYTGNMRSVFCRSGFEIVTDGSLRRGDVLLNEVHHTALYIGSGQMVEARVSELGTTWGAPGDQTGREICVCAYRDYPWDCVLRYMPGPVAEPEDYAEQAITEENLEERSEGYGREGNSSAFSTTPAEVHGLPTISTADVNDVREDVKSAQTLLNLRLRTDLEVDGQYGANTEAAVRSAQRRYNLVVDGVCGPQTWAALIFGG